MSNFIRAVDMAIACTTTCAMELVVRPSLMPDIWKNAGFGIMLAR